jgi:hypothetical protein
MRPPSEKFYGRAAAGILANFQAFKLACFLFLPLMMVLKYNKNVLGNKILMNLKSTAFALVIKNKMYYVWQKK